YRKEQRSVGLQVQSENLLDRVNVLNFAGLFSGTAVAAPRSVSARLQMSFWGLAEGPSPPDLDSPTSLNFLQENCEHFSGIFWSRQCVACGWPHSHNFFFLLFLITGSPVRVGIVVQVWPDFSRNFFNFKSGGC